MLFFESKRLYRSSRQEVSPDPGLLVPIGKAAVVRATRRS